MYISIWGLAHAALCVLGFVALIFLIYALWSLGKLLRNVNEVVEQNKENIERTLDILPDTMEEANMLVTSARECVEKTSETVCAIEDTVAGVIEVVGSEVYKRTAKTFDFFKIAVEVIKAFIGMMGNKS